MRVPVQRWVVACLFTLLATPCQPYAFHVGICVLLAVALVSLFVALVSIKSSLTITLHFVNDLAPRHATSGIPSAAWTSCCTTNEVYTGQAGCGCGLEKSRRSVSELGSCLMERLPDLNGNSIIGMSSPMRLLWYMAMAVPCSVRIPSAVSSAKSTLSIAKNKCLPRTKSAGMKMVSFVSSRLSIESVIWDSILSSLLYSMLTPKSWKR